MSGYPFVRKGAELYVEVPEGGCLGWGRGDRIGRNMNAA